MKKTSLGIKIDSMYDCCIQDGTYHACFDLRNGKDDMGRPTKRYLVFSFEKDINRLTFVMFSEDEDGDSVNEDVKDKLYMKTKKQIIEKAAIGYKQLGSK